VAGWASEGFHMLTAPAFSKWAIAPKMVIEAAEYARNADVITLHSVYSFPVLLGYLLARRYNKPYCLWPHGALAPFQRRVSAGKKRVYGWLVAQRILNHASAIVFTSQGEREETRSLGMTARSVIIPHGFDTGPYEHLPERGAFRAQYLQAHSGPVVLFLSRLNAKKGLDVLIQAFAQVVEHLPDARLAIVGNSDPPAFESEVQAWLRQYGLAKYAAMTGPLNGESKRQAFADADVFALPSHAENFGVVLFEAMASGVPVVVSDTLNYADEIRRSEAGFVVRRDPREFASATLKLLRDSDLRKRMGENGLRMAQAYSWEACGEKIDRTIQCVLQRKTLPADLTLGG
jgi:glycosyltransferase involved in cell wall biosynthesis